MSRCPKCGLQFSRRARYPIYCDCGTVIEAEDQSRQVVNHYLTCKARSKLIATISAKQAGEGCAGTQLEIFHCDQFDEPVLKHIAPRCHARIAEFAPGYAGRTCRECKVFQNLERSAGSQ